MLCSGSLDSNMPPKPLIQIDHVSQEFEIGGEKIHSLSDVTLSIERGTFTVIFGPSGSGKSTLLNVISGLQTPTTGTVQFNENDIYKQNQTKIARFRAEQIGTIYQDNYWIKSLSVIENVSLPLFALGQSRSKAVTVAKDALAKVGMSEYADKPPFVLSLGEQQRVAAARALVSQPICIIADEPTGNLDQKNGDAIMNLLHKTNKDLGTTIILVTHNLEYVQRADSVIRMRDGKAEQLNATGGRTFTQQLVEDLTEHKNDQYEASSL